MATTAEKIGNAMLRHLAFLDRLNRKETRDLRKLILDARFKIRNILAKNADVFDGVKSLTVAKQLRLERILEQTNEIINVLSLRIDGQIEVALAATAQAEANIITQVINSQIPSELGLVFEQIPLETIARLPFNQILNQGYKERLSKRTILALARSRTSITTSLIIGESFKDAARRLASVIDERYLNQAANIVRTEIHRVATDTMVASYKENKQFIERLEWVTALDEDVCIICRGLRHDSLDYSEGKQSNEIWTVLLAPQPIYDSHPRCRCVLVPVLKDGLGILAELGLDPEEVPAGILQALGSTDLDLPRTLREFLDLQDDDYLDIYYDPANKYMTPQEFEATSLEVIQ